MKITERRINSTYLLLTGRMTAKEYNRIRLTSEELRFVTNEALKKLGMLKP